MSEQPSASINCGYTSAGLPIGLQIRRAAPPGRPRRAAGGAPVGAARPAQRRGLGRLCDGCSSSSLRAASAGQARLCAARYPVLAWPARPTPCHRTLPVLRRPRCGFGVGGSCRSSTDIGRRADRQATPAPRSVTLNDHERPRGNPVGTASQQALEHAAETALWRMCSFFDAPIADIDAAIAADPAGCCRVMRAGFLLTLTEPSLLPTCAPRSNRPTCSPPTPPSASAPLGRANRCAAGDWHGACAALGSRSCSNARATCALQWRTCSTSTAATHATCAAASRACCPSGRPTTRCAPAGHARLRPGGMRPLRASRRRRARGLAGDTKVPWATHAVAHVMEMQGRHADGRPGCAQPAAAWAEGNGFCRAPVVAPRAVPPGGDGPRRRARAARRPPGQRPRCDAAAPRRRGLLWRLKPARRMSAGALGRSGPGLGLTPRDGHSARSTTPCVDDADRHRRRRRRRRWSAAVQRRAERGSDANAAMAREIGLPLMRGLLAFDAGDAAGSIALLAPLRETAHRFGGNHAARSDRAHAAGRLRPARRQPVAGPRAAQRAGAGAQTTSRNWRTGANGSASPRA